ncbi:MAG: type II toxin-antitoxin system VapC family toxin [Burkholderiaceae bacterium]
MSTAPRRRARSAAVAPAPIVLDSSCWMEWFADTERAELFAPAIEAVEHLIVPVLTVYEVVKKLAREAGDETATAALSLMQRGRVVEIDLSLALEATVNGLPLADSLIYATARRHSAVLWTQDAHFDGLPGVTFLRKT